MLLRFSFVPWKYAGPNFVMETPALTHGVSGRLCPSNVKVFHFVWPIGRAGGRALLPLGLRKGLTYAQGPHAMYKTIF